MCVELRVALMGMLRFVGSLDVLCVSNGIIGCEFKSSLIGKKFEISSYLGCANI